MDRGERMSVKLVTNEKVAETSSKGNQEKWKDGSKWYKLDQFGYEALAETIVSILLEKSNIETETPFTFVRYNLDRVNVHRFDRTVCGAGAGIFGNGALLLPCGKFFRGG